MKRDFDYYNLQLSHVTILNTARHQIGDKEVGGNENKIRFFCLLKMNYTYEEINLFL